jgi:hypothetical protein
MFNMWCYTLLQVRVANVDWIQILSEEHISIMVQLYAFVQILLSWDAKSMGYISIDTLFCF